MAEFPSQMIEPRRPGLAGQASGISWTRNRGPGGGGSAPQWAWGPQLASGAAGSLGVLEFSWGAGGGRGRGRSIGSREGSEAPAASGEIGPHQNRTGFGGVKNEKNRIPIPKIRFRVGKT